MMSCMCSNTGEQMNDTECEIVEQVFSLFRHGRRNEIVNVKKQQFIGGQITDNALNEIEHKATQFKQTFLSKLTHTCDKLNINNDCSFYVSNFPRTIQTFLHRLTVFFPELKQDPNIFNSLTKDKLINEYNAVFDCDMFIGLERCRERLITNTELAHKYEQLLVHIRSLLPHEQQLKLFDSYLNLNYYNNTLNTAEPYYIRLINVCDYYKNTNDTLSDEDDIQLKKVLMEVNAYKTVLDMLNEGKDFNVIFNCKILTAIKEELMKEECNRKKLILFSGHDDNLSAILKAFGIDYKKFNYDFNDEVNFVRVKEGNEHYVKVFYNDELLFNPLCNSYKCPLGVFVKFVEENYSVDKETYEKFCNGEIKSIC